MIDSIQINQEYAMPYIAGSMDYAFGCLNDRKSFDDYATWLKTQPVMSFMNTKDWSLSKDRQSIHYKDSTGAEEEYPTSAIIKLGSGEIVFHSVEAMSFFFRLNEDETIDALYID